MICREARLYFENLFNDKPKLEKVGDEYRAKVLSREGWQRTILICGQNDRE